MPTQEEQLALISTAATTLTDAVLVSKASVETATSQFNTTITRVNNLDQVENTADADKELSSAAIAEFLTHVKTSNLATVNGQPLNTGLALLLASSPTSLSSALYDDRNSLRNPVTPQPIPGDALILQYLGLFQFYTTLDEPDDDETCFTANDVDTGLPYGQWLLKVPSYEWTEAHEKIEFRALEEWRDDITTSINLLLADYSAHH
jgi:hypothetical protein